jgi:hypothetical protein
VKVSLSSRWDTQLTSDESDFETDVDGADNSHTTNNSRATDLDRARYLAQQASAEFADAFEAAPARASTNPFADTDTDVPTGNADSGAVAFDEHEFLALLSQRRAEVHYVFSSGSLSLAMLKLGCLAAGPGRIAARGGDAETACGPPRCRRRCTAG